MAKKPEASSLFFAAENNQRNVIETMLSRKGAKPNAKEPTFGMTALHIACSKGHKEIVELLLEKGSDIEAREETGRTSLHTASFRGQMGIVEFLLEKGANVNAQTNDGKSVLDWAMLSHNADVVTLISQKGGKCGKDLKPAHAEKSTANA